MTKPVDSPLYKLLMGPKAKVDPKPYQFANPSTQPTPVHRKMARNWNRVVKWAVNQDKDALIEELVARVLQSHTDRMSVRRLEMVAESGHQVAMSAIRDLKKQKAERQKGVIAKLANDPTQKAKAAARELWPLANKMGWTAGKFHTELEVRGHVVAQDTVRKWLTKLRSTGTC